MNSLTRRYSPIRKVGSIDPDGILKACTINVLPNSAIRTAMSIGHKYSLMNLLFSVARLPFIRYFFYKESQTKLAFELNRSRAKAHSQ